MRNGKLNIIFSGMIAGDPHQGGATWAVLQYLLGLQKLGHEVCFIEPVKSASLRPDHTALGLSANAQYFREVMGEFDLRSSALLREGTKDTVGLPYEELLRTVERADVLFNVSGMLADDKLLSPIPTRVYLDLDPAFNQLWHSTQNIDMRFANHTHFATIGMGIGQADCPVPTCGLDWIHTLQPIVLDHWPVAESNACDEWTTVGNWRGYGSIEHKGVHYGQKVHSLRRYLGLPRRTQERFRLAMAIHPDETRDLSALAENGWQLADPAQVAGSPARYRSFIQNSKGEIGIAKSGYAASRCGWFSDRSICYLASGRPVVAQQTGFDRYVPTGEGLFTFETVDEAVDGIERTAKQYVHHSRAARHLAEEYFDSDKVLDRLLVQTGVSS